MSITRFIGGVAAGVEDLKASISESGKARRRAEQAAKAKAQLEQAEAGFQLGERQRGIKASNDSQIALSNLGANQTVANATQDLALRGENARNNLAQSNLRLTGEETRQTLGVAGNEGRQTISAKADADVTRMGGWADNVLPAFRENVIAPAQQHELALMDRTFGATAPLELSGQLEREQMGLQKEMFDKQANDPFNRLEQLARIGAMAGSLFMA